MARVLQVFAAEGLGDERVHAEKEAGGEDSEGVVESFPKPGGADGNRAVGEAADHDGVHDAHKHPAEFGEDQGEGEAQRGDKLLAQGLGGRRRKLGHFPGKVFL